MYATILMDIEDLVASEADDIAATCANILAEEGVTATFCIVGEKARLLQEIFIGHPTRILHEEFRDAPNFADGANPPRSEWRPAPRKSQAALERALNNFRRAAHTIKSLPGIELKTIRQMNEILASAPSSPLSAEEEVQVWPAIGRNLLGMAGWPILPRDIDLTPICRQTQALLPTLERFEAVALHGM